MDSFEINKLIGALLGTVFVVFSIGLDLGRACSLARAGKAGLRDRRRRRRRRRQAARPSRPRREPIGPLLAKADPNAGEAIFKKCLACHTGDKGGANKVGPNLWGIVNRPVASHEGFAYSAGMKEFSEGGKTVWDYDHLSDFLTAPKAYVKGTAMGFAGLKKIEDRANVIAYLRTLADTPRSRCRNERESVSRRGDHEKAGFSPAFLVSNGLHMSRSAGLSEPRCTSGAGFVAYVLIATVLEEDRHDATARPACFHEPCSPRSFLRDRACLRAPTNGAPPPR